MHLRGDKCVARAKGRYQKPGSGGGHECTCVQHWGVAAGGVYSTHCVHTLVTPSPLIPSLIKKLCLAIFSIHSVYFLQIQL